MTDLAQVAVYLARRGWAVYPQAPHSNIPTRNCPPCRNGECPGVPDCPCLTAVNPCHALHAATTDVDLTAARWEHAPRCNPALHLGRSRLVVIDLDCHADTAPDELAPGLPNPGITNGLGSFATLLDHLGQDWPEDTLTVESPTGGLHIYYQAPRVPLRHTHAAWQVEVKAGASSITAPGSVRRLDDGTTGTYRRISDTASVAPFPRWLGEWLVRIGAVADPTKPRPVVTPQRAAAPSGHSPAYWDRVLNGVLDRVATKDNGAKARYQVIYAATRRLANLAVHDAAPWSEHDAITAVVDTACAARAAAGRPERRAEATEQARRGWRKGCGDGPESLAGLGRGRGGGAA